MTFKIGENITLKNVTRKYACKAGIVKKRVKIYTDNTKRYPSVYGNEELNLSTDSSFGEFCCNGYVIEAYDYNGDYKETVTMTEGAIRKIRLF